MDWHRTADGNDLIIDSEAPHGFSGLDTITLRQPELQLRPLSRRRVPITVALPRDATGERYAALSFDRTDIQLDVSPTGRVRRSTMMRIYAQGTGDIEAEITGFEADRQPNGVVALSLSFRNTGNVGFTPEVSFRIIDKDNNSIGKVKPLIQPLLVQAGCEGKTTAEWSRVLDPGEYTAEVTFKPTQNKPPLVERATFVVPDIDTLQKANEDEGAENEK